MKVLRNSIAGIVLGVAMTVSWFVGSSLVKDGQFARAQERVEASRQQIANVQDLAAVYKAVGKAVEPNVVNIEVTKTVDNPFRNRARRFGPGMPNNPNNPN